MADDIELSSLVKYSDKLAKLLYHPFITNWYVLLFSFKSNGRTSQLTVGVASPTSWSVHPMRGQHCLGQRTAERRCGGSSSKCQHG